MGTISQQFIDELKYRCDAQSIIGGYVAIKRQGRNVKGLCPFHNEKTPSFVVYPESHSFYCFGCGAGGDVVTFVKLIENVDYIEAIRILASKVGMNVPENDIDDGTLKLKSRILEANRDAAKFFHENLKSPKGKEALTYLFNRELTTKTITTFGIGYASQSWDELHDYMHSFGYNDDELLAASLVSKGSNKVFDQFRDRIMFPIIDLKGSVIGFGGRDLGDKGPKYLNSHDTLVFKKNRNLYSLNLAKKSKPDSIILAEGYMDVISIAQGGFPNAVASLGTSLTEEQAKLISQYAKEVIIAYDADEAGQKATRRAMNILKNTGLNVKVLAITGAKDPDEFIKKFGSERFLNLINSSSGGIEYQLDKLKDTYDIETSNGKIEYLKAAMKILIDLSPIERDVYSGKISTLIGVSREILISQANKEIKKKINNYEKDQIKKTIQGKISTIVHRDPEKVANGQAAITEEHLIVALFKNPDYLDFIALSIIPQNLVITFNRKVYEILVEKIKEGIIPTLSIFSESLTNEEMGRLSGILVNNSDKKYIKEDIINYINIIKLNLNNKVDVRELDRQDFLENINKTRENKNIKKWE